MHLHIPDGVLPLRLWLPGLALALVLLAWAARGAARGRQAVAYQGALGALALAAMALEIPLGPLEYHLTLIGPLGVLLGPAAAFVAVFIVNAILALLGHGGLTVVGLNALVLGAGAVLARPVYRALAGRMTPAAAFATATVAAQAVSGALWLALVTYALRLPARAPGAGGFGAGFGAAGARVGLVAGLAFPMALVGIAAEAAVAYGIARFLGRVRPDLLPAPAAAVAGARGSAGPGAGPAPEGRPA